MIEKILHLLNKNNHELLRIYNSGEYWIYQATAIIKTTIAQFGKDEFNCWISTHSLDIADGGEWLYDLVLYEMVDQKEFSRLKKIHLVVESEFSKINFGGFKEDFDKLFLASKATKLFIFRRKNEAEFEKVLQYGQLAVNDFEDFDINDSIHLIYWDEIDGKEFKYKEFKKQLTV